MQYSITKEQLRKLTDPQVKEWFPEAFKVELEVGKWYNHKEGSCLAFVEKITGKDFIGFGFNYFKTYKESCGNWTNGFEGWKEATQEEVFEALENEAIKKGFGKKGVHFKDGAFRIETSDFDGFDFWNRHLDNSSPCKFNISVKNQGGVIFRGTDGKWATIIPTITKAEAEKELNKKIID